MSSIARWERRDMIDEMNRKSRLHWAVRVVAIVALASLAGFMAFKTLYPLMHPQAVEPIVIRNGVNLGTLSSFCRQAVLDHDSYGRELSVGLKSDCGI
jgi:hypothetical protein